MALVKLDIEKVVGYCKRLHLTVAPSIEAYEKILDDLHIDDIDIVFGKSLDKDKKYPKAVASTCRLHLLNNKEYPYAELIEYYKKESNKMLKDIKDYLIENPNTYTIYLVQPLKFMKYNKLDGNLEFKYIVRFE